MKRQPEHRTASEYERCMTCDTGVVRYVPGRGYAVRCAKCVEARAVLVVTAPAPLCLATFRRLADGAVVQCSLPEGHECAHAEYAGKGAR